MSRSAESRRRKASLVIVQGRSLAFGPVEEVEEKFIKSICCKVFFLQVHYLEEKQRVPLASRLSRGKLTSMTDLHRIKSEQI